jgi:hypothetical protein
MCVHDIFVLFWGLSTQLKIFLMLLPFSFWWNLGLKSWLDAHKAGILPLEPHLHFALVILEMGVSKLFASDS